MTFVNDASKLLKILFTISQLPAVVSTLNPRHKSLRHVFNICPSSVELLISRPESLQQITLQKNPFSLVQIFNCFSRSSFSDFSWWEEGNRLLRKGLKELASLKLIKSNLKILMIRKFSPLNFALGAELFSKQISRCVKRARETLNRVIELLLSTGGVDSQRENK